MKVTVVANSARKAGQGSNDNEPSIEGEEGWDSWAAVCPCAESRLPEEREEVVKELF